MTSAGAAAKKPNTIARSAEELVFCVAEGAEDTAVFDAELELEPRVPLSRIAFRWRSHQLPHSNHQFGCLRTMNPANVSVLDSLVLIAPTPPLAHEL